MPDFLLSISVAVGDCDKLLALKNPQAVALYLFLRRHNGCRPTLEEIRAMGLTAEQVKDAIFVLQDAGLLTQDLTTRHKQAAPHYNPSEIANGIQRDQAFEYVVECVSEKLDKILSSSDLQILYSIYDWRGFTPGMILLLVNFCVWEQEQRLGKNANKPALKQIEREAAMWERRGITDEQQAEQHVKYLESLRQQSTKIYRLLGVVGRAPSPTEKKFVESWTDQGIDITLIEKAYDITVTHKGQMIWAYCNAILINWQENNCKTLSDVAEFQNRQRETQKQESSKSLQTRPGQAEKAAMRRLAAQRQSKE